MEPYLAQLYVVHQHQKKTQTIQEAVKHQYGKVEMGISVFMDDISAVEYINSR